MELKLTEIALNRSKNHIRERTTDKGVQVGIFFIELVGIFKLKLTEIALNCSKNHIGKRTADRGVKVGISFSLKTSWHF